MDLWKMMETLKSDKYEWVDLSQPVSAKTRHYWLFGDMEAVDILSYDKEGVSAREYKMVSQYGTHIDPPSHFVRGARALHEIRLRECALPLCVVDVSAKAAANNDYVLTVDDLREWEGRHGKIPADSFVAMRTDWHKREGAAFFNKDANGGVHYPGWTIAALEFLCKERNVCAIGHEPPDTDAPGAKLSDNPWASELFILQQDRYQIEMLTNLDKLPATGAVIFVGFPSVVDAPGFTVRCYAVFEKQ